MIITTDDISRIRKKRKMYFAPAHDLSSRMVGEALILGAKDVSITTAHGLWLIAADIDWLTNAASDPMDLFSRIVAFTPEPNSMWTEVLLSAYCDSVITWSNSKTLLIKGEQEGFGPLIERALQRHRVDRIVGFSTPL